MSLQNVSISVPEEMVFFLNIDEDQSELERNAMLLYPYIKNLTISHGRAAKILGIPKWQLITMYDNLGLPYLDDDFNEVLEDMATYDKVKEVCS